MSERRRALLIAGAVVAGLLLVGLVLWLSRRDGSTSTRDAGGTEVDSTGPMVSVTLYYPSLSDRRLHAEERSIPESTREEKVRSIVAALLEGPQSQMLAAPLPGTIELAGVFFGEGGVIYLDLRQPDQERPPALGSLEELLAVYSLVDSVALNTPGIDRVALLWNGSQPESFSGHVDTARPLTPNRKLLAESP
ncbi:MAG: GerMN domain-containing protein [Acidobacteria bacterium]|nr:GerMN domain-containing protein [Acidobacteriota bacterium]